MQTVPSPTQSVTTEGNRAPGKIADAVQALEALDHATFLEVVMREAQRRNEALIPVGRALACELWDEACADVFPSPVFDESVWAEIRRDGRWDHLVEVGWRDLRSQASLVVDIVVDSRGARDDGPSHAQARRYAYDDEE
ncbi:MAG: hypothetical protein ACOYN3_00040 [Acidimicrobiia bacterium]